MAKSFTVFEGAILGTQTAKRFETEADAAKHVLERVGALVADEKRARYEKAVKDRVVSEDGKHAVSEVVAGSTAYAKAMAAAFAPQISLVVGTTSSSRSTDDDDDDE